MRTENHLGRFEYALVKNIPSLLFAGAASVFEANRNFRNLAEYRAGIRPDTNYDTLDYALRNHVGDFFNGSMNTAFCQLFLDLAFPKAPNKFKWGISFLVGAGSIVVAETTGFMTTPEQADIWAGVVGSAATVALGFIGPKLVERVERHRLR